MGAGVDGEGQRVGTRAAIGIGIVVGVSTCSSISGAVPHIVVASSFSIAIMGTGVNGQMEGDDAVAADGIESGELRIESGGSIKAVVPEILVAGGDGHGRVGTMVDNKGQHVGTRTAVGVGIVECINASGSIGGAVPCIVIADGFSIAVMAAVVDCQVEGDDAVAANGIEN